jgi:transcriptional regulator with XRE-family HTH domain
MPFSDNLRYYLEQRRITQTALAKRVNRKHCTIFRWLSGQTVPRLPVAMLVADVLGVTVDELLEDRENPS